MRVLISVIAAVACMVTAPPVAFAQTEGEVSETEVSEGAVDFDPLEPRDVGDMELSEFQWTTRPIIVFADTPADPRFVEQMSLLTERREALLERDVVILTDTDPAARSPIRTELRPRGFSVVVVAKDGSVGLRRPAPRDVREIIRAIDNFQLRQEELRFGN